jgi:malonyl-CoA decarboxylase
MSATVPRRSGGFRNAWRELATRTWGIGSVDPDLGERDAERVRETIRACLEARGGELAARAEAASLGLHYLNLGDEGRRRFLRILAEFDLERAAVDHAVAELQNSDSEDRYRSGAQRLALALQPPYIQVLRRFNSLPRGFKFLVDLRADVLRLGDDSTFRRLDDGLYTLLLSWFDLGFLELRSVTWDTSASLLEKLANYEAVHEVRGWLDLKQRLSADRRCFAFFHPLMPDEPLIFVEVALTSELTGSIDAVLKPVAPKDPREATTAIFYSISNCQKGLAGMSFGDVLIKRVVEELLRELPGLRTFATLSPVPGFRAWLDRQLESTSLQEVLARRGWYREADLSNGLREPLLRLCARYLLQEKRSDGSARDPVAHFHLSNGARLERLDWLADTSARGLANSAGIMVNYLYALDKIEDNHYAYATQHRIDASNGVRALLR